MKKKDIERIVKWQKANTTTFTLKLNNNTDCDIINHLKSLPNKMGYIKKLIRDDIAKEK